MSRIKKEYIECRLYILGDEKVGKKSFVKKLLGLPCTSIIHDKESEEEYNKLLLQYKEDVETDKLLQKEQEEFMKSVNNRQNKTKEANDVTSRFNSTNTLFRIDEERTLRKTNNNFTKNDRTNRNVTGNTKKDIGNTNNLSNSMGIKPGTYKQKIIREPVPEYPAKLYCVNLDKIVIKIFCIPKAEKRPPDFIPRDEDEEYELEKEHNISFDGIRDDLSNKLSLKDTCIISEKLNDFNVSVFTLFIFLYDMSNFYSFESLILYYSKITKMFRFNEEENFKACIIGNKKDKKVVMEADQLSVFNEFLKNTNLKKFEMSTKPFFVFDKFFIEFFFQMFSIFEQNETAAKDKLFLNKDFIQNFEKLVKSRPNFCRQKRADLNKVDQVPGPEYDLNCFGYNSPEEMKLVFSDKKSRFNKKIFANKSGPIFHEDKSLKHMLPKDKDKNIINMEIKGGLYNKPISGYSFGILNGKLNLLQKRKELRNQRSINFNENIDRYNNSPIHDAPLKQSRDEEYFENALKKKILYKQNLIQERQLKMNKILHIHNENLKKIEEEKKIKNKKLILQKSFSTPNLLLNSANNISPFEEMTKEKERSIIKQRYHDAIYSKNHINLEKYNKQLSKIRLMSSMQLEPEPYFIDIRENMLNPSKGIKMHEEFKLSRKRKDLEPHPQYRLIKDDFDKIVESGEKKIFNLKDNEDEIIRKIKREEKINQEEQKYLENLEKKEEKRNKWILNKEESIALKKKQLQELSVEKFLKHQKLLEQEEDKKRIIADLRRDISIQKGYGDPYEINPINYSQIEESSPKYSIKGRYIIRRSRINDPQNFILGTNIEPLAKKILEEKNRPLPNYNAIKVRLPRIIFNKAERFPKPKPSTDDSIYIPLFDNGIFKPPDHKDFICKEPMSELSQRGNIGAESKRTPSPADYVMKSSFDEIAKKGSKINNIRNKIKMKNEKSKDKDNSKDKKVKSVDKDLNG